MEKTVASISTPLGKGAIAIVRMTGEKALDRALSLFSCKNLAKDNIEPRKMYLGNFKLEDGVEEKCLMVYFKAPFSYTGEDLIEFQIHGGLIITQKILEKILEKDVLLAQPGEFSKRAFLNGKISLDEAESIVNIIESESENELKANLSLAKGSLFKKVSCLQDQLTDLLAKIEVTLDYPEEDVQETVRDEIDNEIKKIKNEIDKILKDNKNSKYLKTGINVAIVGKTNVGKSSLMNSLLGEQKAIVTNIEGTTRDSIEASFFYKGIKINLIDTAGIREAIDEVEKIGIQKSKEILNLADVVLLVFDGSQKQTEQDLKIKDFCKDKKYISVVNKTDKERMLEKQDNEINISAIEGKNIEQLKNKIYNLIINEDIDFNKIILTNERHIKELKNAINIISNYENSKNNLLEIISMIIKNLWTCLGHITGNTENENIIDLIFSKFCLGK